MSLFAFSTILLAQTEVFTINEYGMCEITRTLHGNDAADLYRKAKIWLNASNMQWVPAAQSDVPNEKIDFTATFNSARKYNPFAGMFQEDLTFEGHYVIDGTTATLTLNSVRIRYVYAGYGAKVEEFAIEDKIKDYEKYSSIIKDGPDPTLTKKEQKQQKKEAKDKIEDLEETLTKANQELSQRLDKLSEIFK